MSRAPFPPAPAVAAATLRAAPAGRRRRIIRTVNRIIRTVNRIIRTVNSRPTRRAGAECRSLGPAHADARDARRRRIHVAAARDCDGQRV